MLKRAARNLRKLGRSNIQLRRAPAEKLPFEDSSFDTVVGCWVLCHIGDGHPQAPAEIRRLLKPGGVFRFMEHVRNDESRLGGKIQDILNPIWSRLLGSGCNMNLRTQETFERAGFEIEWVKREKTFPPTSPAIYGVARPA
jgi:ubiquinone/menaquinone biosynthesis C-methylase UbiE